MTRRDLDMTPRYRAWHAIAVGIATVIGICIVRAFGSVWVLPWGVLMVIVAAWAEHRRRVGLR